MHQQAIATRSLARVLPRSDRDDANDLLNYGVTRRKERGRRARARGRAMIASPIMCGASKGRAKIALENDKRIDNVRSRMRVPNETHTHRPGCAIACNFTRAKFVTIGGFASEINSKLISA